jgi:threonine dehydratase
MQFLSTMITPQQKLLDTADYFGTLANVYLKREDLHPHGSHKGRSVPIMIAKYADDGHRNFVISSSGNAAISAAKTINDFNANFQDKQPLDLAIYVGQNINPAKLAELEILANEHVVLKTVINPKQEAFLADKNGEAKNLRQSTDDAALAGYADLAIELSHVPNLSAVFVPTSSGTTAQGLHEGFKKLGLNVEIHIVQTASVHPFVESTVAEPETMSLATAIVDKIGHRKNEVAKTLSESRGAGWIISDAEIIEAVNYMKTKHNVSISPNSALSVAGIKKAAHSGREFHGTVVCLITGL